MQVDEVRYTEAPPRQVGQVFVRLTMTSAIDAGMFRRGALPHGGVRSAGFESALVDTGATHLCLAADIVRTLGLELDRELTMVTAAGRQRTRLYREAGLQVENRSITVQCLELPEGAPILLGAVPVQSLGVEPDLVNHRLRLLPEDAGSTWVMAL